MREIRVGVARAVSKRIIEEKVVVPNNLRNGVFTTCDCDNLDHDKKCNTPRESFNGSMLSYKNHLSKENMGI